MDEKFNSILSIALVPQIVDLIVQKEGMDDISAMNAFYQSKTYELLTKEETKMWHFSQYIQCGNTKSKQEKSCFQRNKV